MLSDCAAFVDEVVGSLWWTARFPTRDLARAPNLRPGNGARHAFYREDPGHPTITLPRRYRTTAVVLHELVHWTLADATDLPNHGRTFTRVLLDVVAEYMGAAKRERLAAGFAEHRVHIGPPPRIAPDGAFDYAWDERLRLGRGATFRIDWSDQTPVEGVLLSRAHRTITLRGGEHDHAIPQRDVWRVTPMGSAP